MMEKMAGMCADLAGKEYDDMKIETADVFEYNDPVDGSVSKNQGQRFIFADKSRIIFRLSGTGVEGATVRLYLEKYEGKDGNLGQNQFDVVKPLADIAFQLSDLKTY